MTNRYIENTLELAKNNPKKRPYYEKNADILARISPEIEKVCNDYKIDNFSSGRVDTLIADFDLLGLDFRAEEIRALAFLSELKREEDFRAAFELTSKLLKEKYNFTIPSLTDKKGFKHFTSERQYLEFCSDRIVKRRMLSKLPDSTQKRIIQIYDRNPDSYLYHFPDSKIDLYFLDLQKWKRLSGLSTIMFRRKTHEGVAMKNIQRNSETYFEELKDDTTKERIFVFNPVLLSKTRSLYFRAMNCGYSYQQFYEETHNKYKNSPEKLNILHLVTKRMCRDGGGAKIIGLENDIFDINNIIANNPEYGNLPLYDENCLKNETKDLAIKRVCRGANECENLELRLQIEEKSEIPGTFGVEKQDGIEVLNHLEYKHLDNEGTRIKLKQNRDFQKRAVRIYYAHTGKKLRFS